MCANVLYLDILGARVYLEKVRMSTILFFLKKCANVLRPTSNAHSALKAMRRLIYFFVVCRLKQVFSRRCSKSEGCRLRFTICASFCAAL